MNMAFHDALNFAWKVHLVESGFAKRPILASYEAERKEVAENLLGFDSRYATLFSNSHQPNEGATSTTVIADEENDFVKTFKSACEFTSGYGVLYKPNIFNWSPDHPAKSPLFSIPGVKLTPGRTLTPSTATRISDANVVHLEQEIPVNGSFRIFIFAGMPSRTRKALEDFSANIKKNGSFLSKHLRDDLANMSYFERHNPHSRFFTICVIYASDKNSIDIKTIPRVLRDYHHHIYADDVPDIRVAQVKYAAHHKLGFNPENGGIVVARPDGHIGCCVQLVEGSATVDALNAYFGAFSTKPLQQNSPRCQL
jgi:phenol hydroxylase-like protein/FAD binding domain-containing protein